MTNLEILGLVLMSLKKDRSELSPSDFWGLESDVESILTSPATGLKSILNRRLNIEWDGVTSLTDVIVGELRKSCECNHAKALIRQRHVDEDRALRRIEYDEALPNVLPKSVIDDAKQTIVQKGE